MVRPNSLHARLRHGTRGAVLGCTLWAIASIRGPLARAQESQERHPTPQAPSVAAMPVSASTDIRQAALGALRNDSHLLASGIEVAVHEGIVEISGTVAASLWKERAARVVGTVGGVRAVVNRIRFVPVRRPNDLVARDVRDTLRLTAALARMPIRVRVANGVVELAGAISSWDEQQLAERVANGVLGVRFCQNQLTWARSIKRTSAIIAADVQSRLDWDPLVQHNPIRAEAHGARVILIGTTGGPAEHSRAVALAWVKGVRSVDAGALVIDSVHRPDQNVRVTLPTDSEISVAIQDLAPRWGSVSTSGWSTSVAAGVVSLNGTVPTLTEARALEGMTRSVVGVVEVRSELRGPWWRPSTTPAIRRRGVPRRR